MDVTHLTLSGHKYDVQHMVDIFSKWSLAIITTADAKGTLDCLSQWQSMFGRLPTYLVTDTGPEYANAEVATYCQE